jgi:predicted alternative tryptophan synthase beta-subunit
MMLAGQALHRTPYSTRAHTDLHLALMESERFKQALASNPQLSEIFSNHVLGEEKAQGMREQGSEEDALMSSYGGGSSTSEGIISRRG